MGAANIQGDQLNMAVFFWYLGKSKSQTVDKVYILLISCFSEKNIMSNIKVVDLDPHKKYLSILTVPPI